MSQEYKKREFSPFYHHYPTFPPLPLPKLQTYLPPNFYPPSHPSIYPARNELLFLVPFALLIIAVLLSMLYMLCKVKAKNREFSKNRKKKKRAAQKDKRKNALQSTGKLSSNPSEEGRLRSVQQQSSANRPETFSPSAPPLSASVESPAEDLPPTYEEVSLPITTESCTES